MIPLDLFAFWRDDLEACLETIATHVARVDDHRRGQTLASLASGVVQSAETPTRSPQRVALETVTEANFATPEARQKTVTMFLRRLDESGLLKNLTRTQPKAGCVPVQAEQKLIWEAAGYATRTEFAYWKADAAQKRKGKLIPVNARALLKFRQVLGMTPQEFVQAWKDRPSLHHNR